MAIPTEYGRLQAIRTDGNAIYSVNTRMIPGAEWHQYAIRKASGGETVLYEGDAYYKFRASSLEFETDYVINYRGVSRDGYGPFMPDGLPFRTGTDAPLWVDWVWAGLDDPQENGEIWPGPNTSKVKGLPLYVATFEWNYLVGATNTLLGRSIPFVSRGTVISTQVYNEVAAALGAPVASPGDPVTSRALNDLTSAYYRKRHE